MKKINWKKLILSILIPLAVGGIASLLTKNGFNSIESLNKPPLYPPSYLFGIVWPILYILMGISSYIVSNSSGDTKNAMTLYYIQLLFNFVWPILFFNFDFYLFSFIWLIALLILVILMTIEFFKINKLAGYLQIPYIIWLIFASYLNLSIYLLN